MVKRSADEFISYLKSFTLVGNPNESSSNVVATKTHFEAVRLPGESSLRFINEFWTGRQRQLSSLHEIAYHACFKPQLPRFFIELLTRKGDTVYDPFAGRGTTIIEAALLGRHVIGNDINPLSEILTLPRLNIPDITQLEHRLDSIPTNIDLQADRDLTMFYHKDTLHEILSIREYLRQRKESRRQDQLDLWIRMVATNRLTGHSSGFFSVYTLPPNLAVSASSQLKINRKRRQQPKYRDVRKLIIKKSKQLIKELSKSELKNLANAAEKARFYANDAARTPEIENNSVHLTVTSPPFLDVVQYANDNWLRWWFNNIDVDSVANGITTVRTVAEWSKVMLAVLIELYRITRRGGWVAFEVGEVRSGNENLEEYVIPLGVMSGFQCKGVLINQQKFTKTANIWGIDNNIMGTNSNRVVMFQKI